ncbi:DNA damage-regulated autophagy modulator protein 1-like [Pelobates fuscus]|uniref:DNA damage-regulated autophagy modulator protein 1-like n=1 Tax=Pelobates fuscus TaxID=191477 RepID=UPI002FE463C0
MVCDGFALLPCVLVFWAVSGLTTAFVLFQVLHVHPGYHIPTISYIGNFYPESIVHGINFSVCTILGISTVYVMYRYIHLRSQTSEIKPSWCKKASLFSGWLWCFGFEVVGIFPSNKYAALHTGGGTIAFLFGALYIIFLSVIGYQSSPRLNSNAMCHFRMCASILTLIFLLPFSMCTIYFEVHGSSTTSYVYYASALFEWLSTMTLFVFILTFIPDFQQITVRRPKNWKDNWIVMKTEVELPEVQKVLWHLGTVELRGPLLVTHQGRGSIEGPSRQTMPYDLHVAENSEPLAASI